MMITPARLRKIADDNDKAPWPDSLDPAIDELRDAADEIERLQGVIDELHRTCGNEMSDNTQGPSETCCKMWARIEEAAEKARQP